MIRQKWFRSLFRRRVLIILLLVLQILTLVYIIASSTEASRTVRTIMTIISGLVSLHVIARRDKGAYKLTWVFLILLFPVFGGMMYLLFNFQSSIRRFTKNADETARKAKELAQLDRNDFNEAEQQLPELLPQFRYLQEYAGFPIYKGTKTKYLSPGEEKFKVLWKSLKKQNTTSFWNTLSCRKARCGTASWISSNAKLQQA